MSDNDSSAGGSAIRLDRTQRCSRPEGDTARRHVDEARVSVRTAERKAHRKTYPAQPPIHASALIARLPEPLIKVDPDDVCRETMLIIDLLGNDAIDIT